MIAGKWILRLAIDGKRREMGMGQWPDVTIAEARERAAHQTRFANRQFSENHLPELVKEQDRGVAVYPGQFGC